MKNINLSKKQVTIIISIVVLVIAFINSIVVIPTGSVGIRTQFGALKGQTLDAGLTFKIPFVEVIKLMNCQIQKIEVNASSASKDLQNVKSKIAINFSIDKITANNLFKDVGMNYQDVIVSPAIQESIKAVSAQYTAEELITKRNEVSEKMLETIVKKIQTKGINVSELNIIDFDFSEEFNKAIEAKQVAQQQTLKAQQDLERIKVEAEQKIAVAKADAEALRLQRQELTADVLKLRELEVNQAAIAKWNGVLPTTTLGDNVPMISIK